MALSVEGGFTTSSKLSHDRRYVPAPGVYLYLRMDAFDDYLWVKVLS